MSLRGVSLPRTSSSISGAPVNPDVELQDFTRNQGPRLVALRERWRALRSVESLDETLVRAAATGWAKVLRPSQDHVAGVNRWADLGVQAGVKRYVRVPSPSLDRILKELGRLDRFEGLANDGVAEWKAVIHDLAQKQPTQFERDRAQNAAADLDAVLLDLHSLAAVKRDERAVGGTTLKLLRHLHAVFQRDIEVREKTVRALLTPVDKALLHGVFGAVQAPLRRTREAITHQLLGERPSDVEPYGLNDRVVPGILVRLETECARVPRLRPAAQQLREAREKLDEHPEAAVKILREVRGLPEHDRLQLSMAAHELGQCLWRPPDLDELPPTGRVC